MLNIETHYDTDTDTWVLYAEVEHNGKKRYCTVPIDRDRGPEPGERAAMEAATDRFLHPEFYVAEAARAAGVPEDEVPRA